MARGPEGPGLGERDPVWTEAKNERERERERERESASRSGCWLDSCRDRQLTHLGMPRLASLSSPCPMVKVKAAWGA